MYEKRYFWEITKKDYRVVLMEITDLSSNFVLNYVLGK